MQTKRLTRPSARAADAFGSYRSTMKVVALACVAIALSVAIMGWVGYSITQRAVIGRLESSDLPYIIKSAVAQVDSRIARAQETALLLANDPTLQAWVGQRESDSELGQMAIQKIVDVARDYDYQNAFIVSRLTGHYWSEQGEMIDIISRQDPDDGWFFDALSAGKPVSVSIDFNNERGDTFVFINALIGSPAEPLGIAGVGLSLKDIAGLFADYQFGEQSNLWLIDETGMIHLAEDLEHRGKALGEVLDPAVATQLVNSLAAADPVITYRAGEGLFDLIHQKMETTGWQLILQIPRSHSAAFLRDILINSLAAGLICLLLMAVVFFLLSTRISNPYRQALLINQELEKQVAERTAELRYQHQQTMDSIDYARRLQEAVIPSEQELATAFREYLLLWRPRDVVGGDFYWLRRQVGGHVLAVADCTGHGVPGALMTMLVTSLLNHIVDEQSKLGPAQILAQLHTAFQLALHRHQSDQVTDDGLDIGICCIADDGSVSFAGAKMNLYVQTEAGTESVPGDRFSVGYRRNNGPLTFQQVDLAGRLGAYWLTTDGLLDQNGGPKGFSFGKSRLLAFLNEHHRLPLADQKQLLVRELELHVADVEQRDDIAVVAFRVLHG